MKTIQFSGIDYVYHSPWGNNEPGAQIYGGQTWIGVGPERPVIHVVACKERELLDDALLAMGEFETSYEAGEIVGIDLCPYGTEDNVVTNGILLRGRGKVDNVMITGLRCDPKRNVSSPTHREIFGILVQNRDEHGGAHGGSVIRSVFVSSPVYRPYATGICLSTQVWPRREVLATVASDCYVSFVEGWSGYTGRQRCVFVRCVASGVDNWYNCDSGAMRGVSCKEGWGWDIGRCAVRLAVNSDAETKEDLVVSDQTFQFVGPGPFYALEVFDQLGVCRVRNITFNNCVFQVPDGAQFYPVSATSREIDGVWFNGCNMPFGSKVSLPNMNAGVKQKLRWDGAPLMNYVTEEKAV